MIGVVEEFDASMVVLAADLRVPLDTVLYISSKNSSELRRDDLAMGGPRAAFMVRHPILETEPTEVSPTAHSGRYRPHHVRWSADVVVGVAGAAIR